MVIFGSMLRTVLFIADLVLVLTQIVSLYQRFSLSVFQLSVN